MDEHAATTLVVIDPQPPDPADEAFNLPRPVAPRDRGAESDDRMPGRLALAVPRPPSADRDLDLDHRRQPVDVRTLEQANLDQAHGPARIASHPNRRLPVMETATAAGTGVT